MKKRTKIIAGIVALSLAVASLLTIISCSSSNCPIGPYLAFLFCFQYIVQIFICQALYVYFFTFTQINI